MILIRDFGNSLYLSRYQPVTRQESSHTSYHNSLFCAVLLPFSIIYPACSCCVLRLGSELVLRSSKAKAQGLRAEARRGREIRDGGEGVNCDICDNHRAPQAGRNKGVVERGYPQS
jgi:hypothetical protein